MAVKAIKAGTLIDCTGADPIKDAVVLVDGKKITEVGPAASVKIPEEAEIIQATGKTVMPGMMDIHIHIGQFNNRCFKNYRVAQWEVTPQLQQMYMLFQAQLCFEMGFTTLRDMGEIGSRGLMTLETCAVRDVINAGCIQGPRIQVAGMTIMTCSHLDLILPKAAYRPDPFMTGDGPWELRRQARLAVRQGADVIKACHSGGGGTDDEEPDIRNMTYEELDAIVDEAHALNKPCACHCFTPESQINAVKTGVDTIEHMVFHSNESLELIKGSGKPMIPTLLHRTDHAIEIRKEVGTAEFVTEKMKQIQPSCYKTFQKCYDMDIPIAMGTDMGLEPGMGTNAGELEVYVDLGMSEMDALLTTTRNAANAIGFGKSLGTIEAGKLADLLILDGNPLDDIKVLQDREKIQMVMKEGMVYVDRRPGHARKEVILAEPDSWRKVDA
ncbi:MAG: amidohydrolase family protein [Hyphomicrobiaceae bacterium]